MDRLPNALILAMLLVQKVKVTRVLQLTPISTKYRKEPLITVPFQVHFQTTVMILLILQQNGIPLWQLQKAVHQDGVYNVDQIQDSMMAKIQSHRLIFEGQATQVAAPLRWYAQAAPPPPLAVATPLDLHPHTRGCETSNFSILLTHPNR